MFSTESDLRGSPSGEDGGREAFPSGRPTLVLAGRNGEIRQLLEETFGDDYDVLAADEGSKAALLVLSHQPDLVLINAAAAGLDGFELCQNLKTDPRTRDIPLIFIGDAAKGDDEIRALEYGAIDFVAGSPLRSTALALRVGNHLAQKRSHDSLLNQSLIDELTGVGNRRFFEEALEKEWLRSLRLGTHLTVAMIDPDRFASYNMRHGEKEGDACLGRIALVLKETLNRPADTVARYGGARFACILPQTDQAGAAIVAERARQAILQAALPHGAENAGPVVTVSLGVATFVPERGQDSVAILRAAELCLDQAKSQGRNRVGQ